MKWAVFWASSVLALCGCDPVSTVSDEAVPVGSVNFDQGAWLPVPWPTRVGDAPAVVVHPDFR